MKLYYSSGACSLSPHIVLRESELEFDLVKVDSKTKKTDKGEDFLTINPNGYVPVLELDDGERLTEGPAIVQYLADRAPQKILAPRNGTFARYRLQEWLNYITSELHKSFGPLFKPDTPEDYKPLARAHVVKRLEFVDTALGEKPYLMGDGFTVADAYFFTVTNWAGFVGVDIQRLSRVGQLMARVRERPSVQAALRAEGLLK
jgi:glutathione S-transferase